mgnify:CR=1 FL=1
MPLRQKRKTMSVVTMSDMSDTETTPSFFQCLVGRTDKVSYRKNSLFENTYANTNVDFEQKYVY